MAQQASSISPIPSPPGLSDCPANRSIMALKNYMETREGYYSQMDKVITYADLSNLDLLGSGGLTYSALKSADTEGPSPPTNLVVTPGTWYNHLSWVNPTDDDFSYIEVWVSTTNSLTNAYLAAIVSAPQDSYDHQISDVTADYYYWIRAVDFAGNVSLFCPRADQPGVEAPGEDTIGERIDDIMDLLKGQTPNTPVYSPTTTYHSGDRIVYNDGTYDKVYVCFFDNGGAGVTGVAPDDANGNDYWMRSGIIIEGDIDGVPTAAVDGNMVVDGSILARSLQIDESLVVGDKVQIADGAIHVNHIGDDSELLNAYQKWSEVSGVGRPDDYADVTADQFSQSLTNIDEGTGRALNGLDASYRITKAVKASILAGAQDGPGLWLTGQYLGYYNGTDWTAYIDNLGQFFFGQDDYNYFAYTGGNLVFKAKQSGAFNILEGGDINMYAASGNPSLIRWYADTILTYCMGVDYDNNRLCIFPDLGASGAFFVGVTTSNIIKRFNSMYFYTYDGMISAANAFEVSAPISTLNANTSLTIDTPLIKGAGVPDIGSSSYPFGALYLTGAIYMSRNAAYIDLYDTGDPKHWYIVNDGGNLTIRENDLSTTRFKFKTGGNLDLDGVLTENAWSIDIDKKQDDVWQMLESIRQAFTHHDGSKLHNKLKRKAEQNGQIVYGKCPSDLIQVLSECVGEVKNELQNIQKILAGNNLVAV